MILDYRILFGQAAAGGEAQKSFDTVSPAQVVTTGAAAKACSVESALKGRGPAKAGSSCESQAPADMELEVPHLSSSSDDSAGEPGQEQSAKGVVWAGGSGAAPKNSGKRGLFYEHGLVRKRSGVSSVSIALAVYQVCLWRVPVSTSISGLQMLTSSINGRGLSTLRAASATLAAGGMHSKLLVWGAKL